MPLQREFFTRRDLVWGAGASEQEKVVSYVMKDNEARQPTLKKKTYNEEHLKPEMYCTVKQLFYFRKKKQ